MSSFVRYQLPFLFWVVLIFMLSAIPSIPQIPIPFSPDKLAHLTIFFVLCMLGRRAFFHQQVYGWLREHALGAAFAFTVFYGVADEFHQSFVPGRYVDLYDIIADAVGGLLFVLWFVWKKRRTGAS